MLRVCKLVRAELQPLLDSAEKSGHLVYDFQGFSLADMRAWAVAAGPERVASMQRWTMNAVMLCPDKTHMSPRSWDEVRRRGGYGSDPIRWASDHAKEEDDEDDDDDYDDYEEAKGKDGKGSSGVRWVDVEMFHGNSVHVDLARLGMPEDGATLYWDRRLRTNVTIPGVIYSWFWWEDWNEHERCEDHVDQNVSNVVYNLVKGPLPPRVSVDTLCEMLHELSYGIRDKPSIRENWARCLRALRYFDKV